MQDVHPWHYSYEKKKRDNFFLSYCQCYCYGKWETHNILIFRATP